MTPASAGCIALVSACSILPTLATAQSVTELLRSGPSSQKLDLVVVGEGFAAGADQSVFDSWVRQKVLDGVFAEGPVWESMNAFNIYRLNLNSPESGVTQLALGCFPVAFSGGMGTGPVALATKVTRSGGDGGWLRRCALDANHIGLAVDEDLSQDGERGHAGEVAGVLAFSTPFTATLAPPATTGGAPWRLEAGVVNLPNTTAGAGFVPVPFQQSFPAPPLVFALPSNEGGDPVALRIRNVTANGFDLAQVEPPGSDGPHAAMSVHYLAVEPGVHWLPDGTRLEAGSVSTAAVQHGSGPTGPTGWANVAFTAAFGAPPAFLAEIQTMANETAAVPGAPSVPWLTAAVAGVTGSGARLALERSEVASGAINSPETIAYLAIAAGRHGVFPVAGGSSVTYDTALSAATVQGWGDVAVSVVRNSALGYRYSGIWDRCWIEPGPDTYTRLHALLDKYTPGWDLAAVVLNETGGGGCARGSVVEVTVSGDWPVLAHEFGHQLGGLADEYCGTGTASGSEPGAVNLTMNTDFATLKWRDFVNPATPVPTGVNANPGNGACTPFNQGPAPAAWSDSDDAGEFEGGRHRDSGIFRPAINSRMRGNRPPFCPVCYDEMKRQLDPYHEHTFLDSYAGDFTGDGRTDVVIHNANSLALYQSVGNEIEPLWIATGKIPLWDDFKPGDRFVVADFDGDGRDDLFVVNFTDWAIPYLGMLRSNGAGFDCVRRFDEELPGWDDMRPNDRFFAADFDRDGDDDLYVFNGRDWSVGYLEMLASTGNNLHYVRRYDEELPGWDDMKPNDQFFVGDFNRDSRDDLYVFNGRDWSVGYLEMLASTGGGLSYVRRYDRELPGWDDMKRNDQFFVADFDADSREDLYVFNGLDWSLDYLQMLRSTGSALANVRRFDGDVPGWDGLASHDQFFVADVNGDGRKDLYVVNTGDWATEYLGTLRSTGTSLTGGWQADWIGSWNLGAVDRFLVGNFNGGAGWEDLFVRNQNWFGLLRSSSASVQLTAIHPQWIHRHRYHRLGWW